MSLRSYRSHDIIFAWLELLDQKVKKQVPQESAYTISLASFLTLTVNWREGTAGWAYL